MKKLLVLSCILAVFSTAFSQNQDHKLTRKEQREIKKQEDEAMRKALAEVLVVSIDTKQWVLEANTLVNKYGNSVQVSSTINFVAIEGEEAFIQLGSNSGLGANGVGGVSVRGNITSYKADHNEKKGTYYIIVMVSSPVGSYDIRINCSEDGTMATATIQGLGPNRVTYRGNLLPIEKSNVYKGTPVF